MSAPANEEEVEEYRHACAKADVEPADTLRKLAKAFALHVRRYGRVAFPLRLEGPTSRFPDQGDGPNIRFPKRGEN